MNETIRAIRNRRSIRKYGQEQIDEQELQAIIEAGLYAPSANNQQAWHFTVIQDQQLLHELNLETKGVLADSDDPFLRMVGANENMNIFNGAPTVIVVAADEACANSDVEAALATENMLIAAESLGIASCYIISISYLFEGADSTYFKEKLGIPATHKVQNAILLGYSAVETPKAAPRKEGLVNYIR